MKSNLTLSIFLLFFLQNVNRKRVKSNSFYNFRRQRREIKTFFLKIIFEMNFEAEKGELSTHGDVANDANLIWLWLATTFEWLLATLECDAESCFCLPAKNFNSTLICFCNFAQTRLLGTYFRIQVRKSKPRTVSQAPSRYDLVL